MAGSALKEIEDRLKKEHGVPEEALLNRTNHPQLNVLIYKYGWIETTFDGVAL